MDTAGDLALADPQADRRAQAAELRPGASPRPSRWAMAPPLARPRGRRRTGCSRLRHRVEVGGVGEQARGLGARSRRRRCRRAGPSRHATASGRSVVSRSTSTGLPRAGASSWTPPESVSTIGGELQRAGEVGVVQRLGDVDVGRGLRASAAAASRTMGLRCAGSSTCRSGKSLDEPCDRLAVRVSGAPQDSRRWLVTSSIGDACSSARAASVGSVIGSL